ncbi:MAG: ABC transporter permease subunit [Candidatus Sungbacteria bacterium]|nr:ABC transporter permease subunit [Candidatus Sungbacteria bacterium]
MKNIFVIAKNTFRAAIRDRILHGILVFALLFILFTVFLGSISLGEDLVVIRSIGLAGMYLFGMIITIFLASSLISLEIERRTLYLILSKPVSTLELVLGKFFGLFAAIALITLCMAAVYLGVVAYAGGGFDAPSLGAIVLQIFEAGLFVAMVMLFSSLATPFAAAIYGILVLYIGHSLSVLLQYVQHRSIALKAVAKALYYIVPNLEKFNIRNAIVHHMPVDVGMILLAGLYALLYAAVLLYLAKQLLAKKDL